MSVSLQSLMFEPVVARRKPTWVRQLVTFLAIGAVASGAYIWLCTVAAGLGTGAPGWLTNSICYTLFLLPAYLAHRSYSFRSDAPHQKALPRYTIVQVISIACTGLFSFVSYSVLGMETAVGAMLALALTAGVKFVVLRTWAFDANH
jgi:putative flippase GtrA